MAWYPSNLRIADPSRKAWYLLYFSSLVCVLPYLNVHFARQGLTNDQLGTISALRPWLSAPAGFAWSALADRFSAHKRILLLTLIASTVARTFLILPTKFGTILAMALAVELVWAPVGVLSDAAVLAACTKESDYGKYRLWGAVGWGMMSFVAGAAIDAFGMPTAFWMHGLLAAPCILLVARLYDTPRKPPPELGNDSPRHAAACPAPEQVSQGSQDQPSAASLDDASNCGSVASLCTDREEGTTKPVPCHTQRPVPAGAGCRNQGRPARVRRASSSSASSDEGSGIMCTPLLLPPDDPAAMAGVSIARAAIAEGTGASAAGGHFFHDLLALLRRRDVLLFFYTTCVMGIGFGTIDSFLFVYLGDLGASEALMGLTLTVSCAAEVPVFQLQDRLLDRIGITATLDIVQATYALRMALYALLPLARSPWAVLPVEALHGITFACGWGAGTVNCKLLAPDGLAATMQGAFQGLYFGAGYGIGALSGGLIAKRYGLQMLYAIGSCAMVVLLLIGIAARRLLGLHQCLPRRATPACDRGNSYMQLASKDSTVADGC